MIYFLGLVIVFLMNSCAMQNEVHFNKNYSGTYALKIDFGDMFDMIKSMDPSLAEQADTDIIDEALNADEREEVISKINQVDGISNANFVVNDKSSLEFKFDFKDIESLNSAFSEIQSAVLDNSEMAANGMDGMNDTGMAMPKFSKNGKVISHGASFPEDQIPEDAMEGLNELGGSDGMMEMVMGMMDYTVELSFDRKIKSVEIDGVDLVSQDKHVVKTRVDLGKMIEGGAFKIDVRTK